MAPFSEHRGRTRAIHFARGSHGRILASLHACPPPGGERNFVLPSLPPNKMNGRRDGIPSVSIVSQKQKQTQKARALRRRRTCPARRRCAWASARACERTCARRRLLTATVAPACVAVRSNAVSDGEQHEGADERREEETKEKRQQPFDAVAKKEPERAEQNEAKSKFPASASLGLLRVPEGHAPPRNRYIAIAITGILGGARG